MKKVPECEETKTVKDTYVLCHAAETFTGVLAC